MKILIVTNMYPTARMPGYGTFVAQQARGLQASGHEVDVLIISGHESRLNYVRSVREIVRRTRENRYDIVHAHYGLSGVPALFRRQAPLVVTLHGSDAQVGWLQPLISRLVARFADAVIAVSNEIQAVIPGEVIPCGVDLQLFRPIPQLRARCELGLSVSKKFILFPFSPDRKVKRYDLARSSVQRLKQRGHDLELLVVHDVEHEKMPLYYNAADVLILCSESEGSPTSVKEALACNLPVVSTDCGDVKQILERIEGTVICPADPYWLARGLEQVLAWRAEHEFDGRKAMRRYDQRLTIESVEKVYRQVLERRVAQPRRLSGKGRWSRE